MAVDQIRALARGVDPLGGGFIGGRRRFDWTETRAEWPSTTARLPVKARASAGAAVHKTDAISA